MGLGEDVYTAISECRPPGNRNPQPDEIGPRANRPRRQSSDLAQFVCAWEVLAARPCLRRKARLQPRGAFMITMESVMPTIIGIPCAIRMQELVWQDVQMIEGIEA